MEIDVGKGRCGCWSVRIRTEYPGCRARAPPLRATCRPTGVWHNQSRMSNVQIFGIKNSAPSRAAERFFKERRVPIQYVDLKKKPMSGGEIRRFTERFGLERLLDTESAAYVDAGLKYMRMTDAELLSRIERDPRLLRLPLVRAGNRLSVGQDEDGWKEMLAT